MTEKPQRIESDASGESPPAVDFSDAVSKSDMTYYSSRMDDLRTGGTSSGALSVPDLGFIDGKDGNGIRVSDESIRSSPATIDPGFALPDTRIRFSGQNPQLRDFQNRGEEPSERGLSGFRLDDLIVAPPRQMDKLPSPEEQARLREQAQYIADVIGTNGDFYAGLKRENIEQAFEAATRAGEENLNFLVQAVNANLARTNPNLQLAYSFGTDKAWYSKDTRGATIYHRPISVDENRSTIAINRTDQNRLTTEDRIITHASRRPPGYLRAQDPNRRAVLE